MQLFVLDAHAIYRRGLVASLEVLDGVGAVGEAASVAEAWEDPRLLAADLVLVDPELPGGERFIADVRERTGAQVIVCSAGAGEAGVVAAMQGGAAGCLRKDALTAEGLSAAVRAAASGSSVVTPAVLSALLRGVPADLPAAAPRLTDREQRVLALIADGRATREVAAELSYSERTVKNVLHDVVTKLNARTRSQAVAFAVRDGLI